MSGPTPLAPQKEFIPMKTLVEFVRTAVANGITLTRTLVRVGGKSVRVAVRVVITDDAG